MNCKFCNAELEEENLICPACGKDNTEAAAEETVAAQETEAAAVEAEETAEVQNEETAVAEETEAVEEAEVTEEAVAEAEEIPQQPKKTWKKVVAIACCAVAVIGIAVGACFALDVLPPKKNDVYCKDSYTADAEKVVAAADKVIATIDGHALTNEQLQMFYWMEFYNFMENYSGYLSYFGLDYTKPLSQQYVTDTETTWEQFFLEQALNTWHRYQTLVLMAEEENYQMPETLTTYLAELPTTLNELAVSYGFETGEEMITKDMGPGCTMDAYVNYMSTYYKGVEYFDTLYVQVDPTMEEVEAFFDENADTYASEYNVTKDSGNLIDVRHILVFPEGGTEDETGNTTYNEDEWAAAYAKAEQILGEWTTAGGTEQAFAELANKYSQDGGSNTNGGLYTMVAKGDMVENFDAWCFEEGRAAGDTGIVQTEFGYHIMYFVYGDAGWLRCATDDLVSQRCDEVLKAATEAHPMTVNYKSILLGQATFE